MGIDFEPQKLDVLAGRFDWAIKETYDTIAAPGDDPDRPGLKPECVFDHLDGLRLIVSKNRINLRGKARIVIAVSASYQNQTPWDQLRRQIDSAQRKGGEEAAFERFRGIAVQRFRLLSNWHEVPVNFVGQSSAGVLHWHVLWSDVKAYG